ncbi:MAG: hypothetical protein ACJ76M_02930 [Solirubrobacteraceae bacterium]
MTDVFDPAYAERLEAVADPAVDRLAAVRAGERPAVIAVSRTGWPANQ